VSASIDPEDLVDATGIAEMLGIAHRNSVSVYQGRYPDMPRPLVYLGPGRPRLWSRRAVQAWATSTDLRSPQAVVKAELAEVELIGHRFAQGRFRSCYSLARQHGLGRGKGEKELPPTRRAAFEIALADAKVLDPAFQVRMPEGWLDPPGAKL